MMPALPAERPIDERVVLGEPIRPQRHPFSFKQIRLPAAVSWWIGAPACGFTMLAWRELARMQTSPDAWTTPMMLD